MSQSTRDYAVLDKFNLERKPVGVEFLITRLEGIKDLKKKIAE